MLRTPRSPEPPRSAPEGASGTPPLIQALTGIRAIMAIWVVADHVRNPLIQLLPAAEFLRPFLEGGFLALETFFILSGFIISHNYAERLATLDRRSYRAFMWARVARIYPTHIVGLLAMTGVLAGLAALGRTVSDHLDYSVWTFLGNVFLLQALPGVTPWNSPSWSVSCEFAAYLVFPFAAAAVFRASRRRALSVAALVVAVELVLLNLPVEPERYLVTTWWIRIVAEFSIGCLLWAAWRHGVRPHLRWDAVAALGLAGAIAVACSVETFGLKFLAVPFLAVFVVAVASSVGPVRRLLGSRPLEWGGRTSYSVYLVHWPVLLVLWTLLPAGAFVSASLPVRVALVASWFVATFAAGAVVYHLVEEPARRRMKRYGDARGFSFARRPRPDDAAAAPAREVVAEPVPTPAGGTPRP